MKKKVKTPFLETRLMTMLAGSALALALVRQISNELRRGGSPISEIMTRRLRRVRFPRLKREEKVGKIKFVISFFQIFSYITAFEEINPWLFSLSRERMRGVR